MNEQQLQQLLDAAQIDTSSWGSGKAKSMLSLVDEFNHGELRIDVYRVIRVCRANIFVTIGGQTYHLVEDRQEFLLRPDVRKRKLKCSLSEKMYQNEDPAHALMRALKEELGIEQVQSCSSTRISKEVQESESYPGLMTEYHYYDHTVYLFPRDYYPDGYVEEQLDVADPKKVYFLWERAG